MDPTKMTQALLDEGIAKYTKEIADCVATVNRLANTRTIFMSPDTYQEIRHRGPSRDPEKLTVAIEFTDNKAPKDYCCLMHFVAGQKTTDIQMFAAALVAAIKANEEAEEDARAKLFELRRITDGN